MEAQLYPPPYPRPCMYPAGNMPKIPVEGLMYLRV